MSNERIETTYKSYVNFPDTHPKVEQVKWVVKHNSFCV